MNLYLNYARENWTNPDENPPIGLILCSEHDAAVAHYSLGNLGNQVLAREYQLALPTEEQLEIDPLDPERWAFRKAAGDLHDRKVLFVNPYFSLEEIILCAFRKGENGQTLRVLYLFMSCESQLVIFGCDRPVAPTISHPLHFIVNEPVEYMFANKLRSGS